MRPWKCLTRTEATKKDLQQKSSRIDDHLENHNKNCSFILTVNISSSCFETWHSHHITHRLNVVVRSKTGHMRRKIVTTTQNSDIFLFILLSSEAPETCWLRLCGHVLVCDRLFTSLNATAEERLLGKDLPACTVKVMEQIWLANGKNTYLLLKVLQVLQFDKKCLKLPVQRHFVFQLIMHL